MAERLDLTTPAVETLAPSIIRNVPTWLIYHFSFGTGIAWNEENGAPMRTVNDSIFDIRLAGQAGAHRTVRIYNEQEAVDAIRLLNKANLTANSLEKRSLTRLIALASEYAGAISGTPD